MTQFNVLPLLDVLLDLAKSNGDDHHQMHRFVFETRGTGTTVQWRVTAPSSASPWVDGSGEQRIIERVRSAGGNNIYDVEWRFRVID